MNAQKDLRSPASLLASFSSGGDYPYRMILVTGPRGVGKTAWCLELAEAARTAGLSTAGIVSPPVFSGHEKIAIDLLNIANGQRRRLAARRTPGTAPSSGVPATEAWQFESQTLVWGNQILQELQATSHQGLLLVDELGPLELERGQGLQAALPLLDARHFRLACVVVRPELLQSARLRWPWSEVIDLPTFILS